IRRVVCHTRKNFGALFDQQTRKLCGFVRGDRSSDTEHDRFPASGNVYHFSGSDLLQLTSGIFIHGRHIDQLSVSRLLKNVSDDMMLRTFSRSSSTEPLTKV